jgi:hypothetical protein
MDSSASDAEYDALIQDAQDVLVAICSRILQHERLGRAKTLLRGLRANTRASQELRASTRRICALCDRYRLLSGAIEELGVVLNRSLPANNLPSLAEPARLMSTCFSGGDRD